MAEEAIAKARAIAARLAGGGAISSGDTGAELGKRKRWDTPGDDQGGRPTGYAGLGSTTKKKVYIPVKEYPETNFLGLLIGPRGRTQKELETRTGAKILFRGRGALKEGMVSTHPDDDDALHVSVEGNLDSVEKAVRELEDILFNPEKAEKLKQEQLRGLHGERQSSYGSDSSSIYGPGTVSSASETKLENGEELVELKVPNHLVGYVIGRGGENIQKMQAQTGAHIQIAKENEMKPGDTTRSVFLRGSTNGVREMRKRVEELIAERTTGGTPRVQKDSLSKTRDHSDYSFILKVAVPNDKVGIIIGRGGVTIKSIQDRTGAHVQIPTGPDEDNITLRTLSIGSDSREAVEAAQMEIFMVLQQQQQQQLQAVASAPTVIYLSIPDDKVGVIIGKGGTTIKDLQNRHGCRIQIPQSADVGSDPPIRTISISGPPDKQLMIKLEIETIIGLMPGMNSVSSHTAYGQSYGGGYDQSSYGYSTGYAAAAQDPSYVDPTSYYPDFWNYASMYGEEAARQYYGSWSPPVGTPPPPGIVLPVPQGGAVSGVGYAANQAVGISEVNAEGVAPVETPEAIAAAWAQYNKELAEWTAYQQQMQQQGGEVSSSAATGESIPN